MEQLSLEIGNRLVQLRKKINKTQYEVADSIEGMTVQMISSYEKGKQKPGIENLIKIANFYNVSLDYICYGKENDKKSFEISNYSDLIAIMLKLINVKKFGYDIRHTLINDRITISSLTLESTDNILIEFMEKYSKLLEAKDILGDELYNSALNTLLDNYDMPLNKEAI